MSPSIPTRTLQVVLATTLSATAFWVSVHLNESHEVSVAVPLLFLNMPEGHALRTAVPREVELTMEGEGWKLASYLRGAEFTCPIDLGGTNGLERVVTLRDISRELGPHPGVQFIGMTPDSLSIAFEPYVRKKVAVVLNASISYSDGYGVSGRPQMEPDSVIIGGAASIVESIERWRTRATAFEQLKTPLTTTVALDDSVPYLLTFSPPAVTLTLNVQPFAEKTLTGIPIKTFSVPTNRELVLIPPKLEIVVRGAIDQLAVLTPEACGASVDFAAIQEDSLRVLTPAVELPGGLTLISMRPDHVQFIIRRRL